VTPAARTALTPPIVLLAAGAAEACPVCFAGTSPKVLATYWLTAVVLSLLPLVLAGSFALWLRGRFREAAAGDPELG